jgi:hypothetical protein
VLHRQRNQRLPIGTVAAGAAIVLAAGLTAVPALRGPPVIIVSRDGTVLTISGDPVWDRHPPPFDKSTRPTEDTMSTASHQSGRRALRLVFANEQDATTPNRQLQSDYVVPPVPSFSLRDREFPRTGNLEATIVPEDATDRRIERPESSETQLADVLLFRERHSAGSRRSTSGRPRVSVTARRTDDSEPPPNTDVVDHHDDHIVRGEN